VVDNLRVAFPSPNGPVPAVRGVSFVLGQEKLAIVGESGSGKSTIGRALLRLLPRRTAVTATRLMFRDTDLLTASERQMQRLRGPGMAMIMQDPKYSLNPLIPVGEQIAEAYRAHHRVSRRDAAGRSLAIMEQVRIREPGRVFHLYPHQVSGGMGQRIMIAMMLIPEPALLVADEPTSALDVSIRLQVLATLDDLVGRRGIGLIFITHDLTLAATFCDRVLVMYRGRIVEALPASGLADARHPYTRGLLAAVPRLGRPRIPLPVLDRAAIAALEP
jgi:peptide/nickel transport system ATP-binding protein